MPGKKITNQQEAIYMSLRNSGASQKLAAAKAGIAERTGRTIEKTPNRSNQQQRHWRTRKDPFAEVWDTELLPLLELSPALTPTTLLEYLQAHHEDEFPDNLLRSLQRRIKEWRSLYGPEKEVMFRQRHEPGRLGLSDFTTLKEVIITINNEVLRHLLYHFRLAYSGWSHIKVILGGESFTALAEGLQEALWRLGGMPLEHRTDSLSAGFKNLTADEKEDMTTRYEALCLHYQMKATRNNRGNGHENGSVESPHRHIKRRIKQALLLRGSSNFDSMRAYQAWLDDVVSQHNKINAKGLASERPYLQSLPLHKATDFTEICARVSSSSTIDVRRATYTVPSRLEGENLRVHLYHDRLECYLGAICVIILSRVYSKNHTERARNIDYRHVIHSLVKKPQAFRYSQLRDDLLPSEDYKLIWQHADKTLPAKNACQFIVGILHLAAVHHCEAQLGKEIVALIDKDQMPSLLTLQARYGKAPQIAPAIEVTQHALSSYNMLLPQPTLEVCHA